MWLHPSKISPRVWGCMKNLETLDARETNLVKLPESLGLLTGLKTLKLKLKGCKNLVCLPGSIYKLKHLAVINIAGCLKFDKLPEKLNEIEALEELDASETVITEIPTSIGRLEKLQKLSLRGCKRPTSNSWSWTLPLKRTFWGYPTPKGLTVPASILNLKCTKELDLSYCGIDDGSIPDDLGGLSSLWRLDLSGNKFKNLPAGCFYNLLNLQHLGFNYCLELMSLPQAPPYLLDMQARECALLGTGGGGHLSDMLGLNQAEGWMTRGSDYAALSLHIAGNEILSWFENQIDVYLQIDEQQHDAIGVVKIEKPFHWEEMLGIGICILLDDRFYSSDHLFGGGRLVACVNLYAVHQDLGRILLTGMKSEGGYYEIEMKSNHLWMVFWQPGDQEYIHVVPDDQETKYIHSEQLRECTQILLRVEVWSNDVYETLNVGNVPMKLGWRLIRKKSM